MFMVWYALIESSTHFSLFLSFNHPNEEDVQDDKQVGQDWMEKSSFENFTPLPRLVSIDLLLIVYLFISFRN